MLPVSLQGTDVRFLISETTGIKVPVIAARGLVFSAWAPSVEELKQLNEGVPVWLIQRGVAVPEMTMIVATRREVILPEIAKEASARRLDESVAVIQQEDKKLDRLAWQVTYVVIGFCLVLFTSCFLLVYRLYLVPR